MKLRILLFLFLGYILASGCKSKKQCADFSDPKRSYKANYGKNGLVKKKGQKSKPAWDNQ